MKEWEPKDFVALVLAAAIVMFILSFAILAGIREDHSIPSNLELWTALIGSLITGILVYVNKDK